MAQATVKTVQFLDPRIEPQPEPVYDYAIGPTQNQYYKIPASGKSNSMITFNNLTTLGADRAYLDTFEIEITAVFTFNCSDGTTANALKVLCPQPDCWTFDSFPFNKCCEEIRVNINGGAFFSQPMSYLRAKERYMDQKRLAESYQNVCPVQKPILQTESGKSYDGPWTRAESSTMHMPFDLPKMKVGDADTYDTYVDPGRTGCVVGKLAYPTRLGRGMNNYMMAQTGVDGGYNNSIVRLGGKRSNEEGTKKNWGYQNYYVSEDGTTTYLEVTWREPVFCSPFSSRYDATYGRPLYNITSLDITFNMQNLGNMIRIANLDSTNVTGTTVRHVNSYTVNIKNAQLCYQVATIPATLTKPLTTLVPYRRFVPYITDYPGTNAATDQAANSTIPIEGADVTIRSGVYTMNEIPTAIWLFVGPNKAVVQNNFEDKTEPQPSNTDNTNQFGNWDTNKLFAFIKNVNLTMANTTQILNTAEPVDLYRIAKSNGCQDSYWSWGGDDCYWPKPVEMHPTTGVIATTNHELLRAGPWGAGSVLRLIPGRDLIVPDQPLIPGANAYNMVFQAEVRAHIPPHSVGNNQYALWLLFEYVGVAAISPGQCEITMNPLGTGEVMAVSPVVSATSDTTEGELDEGSGFWDKAKRNAKISAQVAKDNGVVSRILRNQAGTAADGWAKSHGLSEPPSKRGRGGAVMGKGLNDWI